MKKPLLILSALTLSAVSAGAAHAAVCVSLDQTRDNLTEQERGATVAMLQQTLRDQGQDVSTQNCMGTYYVYHLRLGSSVTVYMQGPQGYRSSTARAIEELPAVYSQMVRSLLTGQPMTATSTVVDRTNVTSAQQAPRRVEADSLWYARLGYGGAVGPFFNSGPQFGFGYRYELDNVGIDLSFLNFMVASSKQRADGTTSSVGVTGSWVKLMGLYFANPLSNGSLYFGGGLSWGGTAIANETSSYSGSGLQGEGVVGYELLRASTIRIFLEGEATLPFYTVTENYLFTGTTAGGSKYVPFFGASIGLGWGRSNIRVHMIQ